ncbi:MAG: IclR family transcriptional regulator C-terminal domain-containing protein [Sulfitobacter sp.]
MIFGKSFKQCTLRALVSGALRTMTTKNLLTRDEVFDDIRRIRERGYALDDEEFVIGMKCVAAPIWSESGEPIGSLSVSGLAARVTPENIEDVAKHVMAAAKELTDIIGGHPS